MLSCGLTGLTRISFAAASPQILAHLDGNLLAALNQPSTSRSYDKNRSVDWQPSSHTDDL